MCSRRIDLQLPALHPAQQRVIEQAKRFNVLCCGRRWGKTVLGWDRLIHAALAGQPVAWFSPSYKMQSDTWRALCNTLAPVTLKKNEQEKRLELIGGGSIDLWSLDNPDAARGRKYALVVVDEAAMIATLEQAWQQSIRPTLTDLRGEAWFLSTPRGMNYFKVLYDRGQDPEREDWMSWQMPTGANPFISPTEIEAARPDLTEAAFNQEYLALFVNWEGSVFQKVTEVAIATPLNGPEPDHEYVIGVDWGRMNDFTVFLILDTTTHTVAAIERSRRVDYTVQCDRLRALAENWRPRQIIAEDNSAGRPLIEQLGRDELPVVPFLTTNSSKTECVEALALAFERRDIQIPNDPVLISELLSYQANRLPSGLTRYSAAPGQHDDCVMALVMAWTAISRHHLRVYEAPESEIVVHPFAIPDDWPRVFAMVAGWDAVAALWAALDPTSGSVFLYDEHWQRHSELFENVRAIRARGDWIPGIINTAAPGRTELDGSRLMESYRELGLKLERAADTPEAGMAEVTRRLVSHQLKVFGNLNLFRLQYGLYRRDERGHIIRENAQLMTCLHALMSAGLSRMRPKPTKQPDTLESLPYGRINSGPLGWMAM